jgi:antitoxin (DNA-binding transcriptional repressor) of toxin-antitoxin stability system
VTVKTINRRTLNHTLASVLDSVLETGEPVRVESRDGRAVVIGPAPEREETPWERWNRLGLIRKATPMSAEEWAAIPKVEGVSADWLLKEMEEWR